MSEDQEDNEKEEGEEEDQSITKDDSTVVVPTIIDRAILKPKKTKPELRAKQPVDAGSSQTPSTSQSPRRVSRKTGLPTTDSVTLPSTSSDLSRTEALWTQRRSKRGSSRSTLSITTRKRHWQRDVTRAKLTTSLSEIIPFQNQGVSASGSRTKKRPSSPQTLSLVNESYLSRKKKKKKKKKKNKK